MSSLHWSQSIRHRLLVSGCRSSLFVDNEFNCQYIGSDSWNPRYDKLLNKFTWFILLAVITVYDNDDHDVKCCLFYTCAAGPILVAQFTQLIPGLWGWRWVFIMTDVMCIIALVFWYCFQTSDIVPVLNNPTPSGEEEN